MVATFEAAPRDGDRVALRAPLLVDSRRAREGVSSFAGMTSGTSSSEEGKEGC